MCYFAPVQYLSVDPLIVAHHLVFPCTLEKEAQKKFQIDTICPTDLYVVIFICKGIGSIFEYLILVFNQAIPQVFFFSTVLEMH